MTSTVPDPTVGPDPAVGPPPPFDAELLAAFEMASERLAEMGSFGIEDIPALRVAQADLMRVSAGGPAPRRRVHRVRAGGAGSGR
jgi:hypothetical protein